MNLIEEIKQLKAERNAVILAHNYVRPELQEIADFTGDSLELSIKAKNVKAETIVFCGVRFMAETAKLLSPDSVVLLPNPDAGCPMADMAAADAVAAYRAAHPEAFLVAYVNTTADVKAHVDLCCTSGNAEKIIAELPENQEILFLPDRNLGGNMNRKLDRKMDLWPGCCPTHDHVTPEVVAAADEALSTGGILKFVRESFDKAFIIGTESGILHRLRKENPGKEFYPLQPEMICPDMKKITLENVRDCLKNMAPRIELPEEILREAVKPIEAMIARS